VADGTLPRARVRGPNVPPAGEEIHVYAGDPLRVGEESGPYPGWFRVTTAAGVSSWMPEAYLRRRRAHGVVLVEYESRELAMSGGEEVTLLREIAGWFWCRAADGREGWLPGELLEPLPAGAA
jgi:SH3-like domain-containing protein